MLVADDPGVVAVNEFGLFADTPFARFDPDPVPVADAQFPGRLAVDLHQGIRVEFPKLGDLVVLGVEKVGRPASSRKERIILGQLLVEW